MDNSDSETTSVLQIKAAGLETVVRASIKELDAHSLRRPETFNDTRVLCEDFTSFLIAHCDAVYEATSSFGDVLEDKLRTIFIQSEDATLEGFAGELETQLAQLRLIGGEIKDIPLEFNGECSELFVSWNKTIKTLLYNGFNTPYCSALAVSEYNREMPGTMLSISLLTGSFLKAKSYKMSLRESCSKLLSVISMVMGKWETKIEDRIDLEELNEGLVMSGGMVIFDGKKKTSRGKKHNHSSIYY